MATEMTFRQGELRPVPVTESLDAGTLLITGTPTVSLTDAANHPVVGLTDVPATHWTLADQNTVTVWYDLDSGGLAQGDYTLLFTFSCTASDGEPRIFRPKVLIAVEGAPASTIDDAASWLRNLLDDEDPTSYFWSDVEIVRYLEEFRESVRAFAPNTLDANLHAEAFWNSTRGAYGYNTYRWRSEARLAGGPDNQRYQAVHGYRHWAETPAPTLYVTGQEAVAAGHAYTIDSLAGAVTFAAPLPIDSVVCASFDHYRVYESAYAALTVALSNQGAIRSVSTSSSKVVRESLLNRLKQIHILRRIGTPRVAPSYRRMS